jgi:hypothetical protein
MPTESTPESAESVPVAGPYAAPPPAARQDTLALWAGVAFAFVFTLVIWLGESRLAAVPHLPDQGASWYYWKLPAATFASRASAWGLYLSQQLMIWGLIWYAQRQRPKYSTGLHPVNIAALAVNCVFVFLHLVQTHVWYDGLAQDVSIFSSQGSVIVMLIWIMLMENNRRGVLFGNRLPISKRIVYGARKYHGYFFAWAVIYTFWFHPMETTNGHLVGFFYTFLLLLQGSLFFTRIHINRWWMFVQEIIVLAHGTLVAIVNGNDMWPMFFFGFAGIFVITQMHGLGLSRKFRWGILAAYVLGAVWIYSDRGADKLWELSAIPIIDYLGVVVLALLIGAVVWVADRLRGAPPALEPPAAGEA